MSNGTVHVPTRAGSTAPVNNRPAQSGDIRGEINFVKSEIRLNYYFSEEEAKSIVERLNKNDAVGAASIIRYAVQYVMEDILIKNLHNKVKIIHEAFPEMYLENYYEYDQPGAALSTGQVLTGLVENLCVRLSGLAFHAVRDYFKSRAAEFKRAQAQPEDGVTIRITWMNIAGMAAVKRLFDAIRNNRSLDNLNDVRQPNLPKPEIEVIPGKHFD
jgi:hypothetical protein